MPTLAEVIEKPDWLDKVPDKKAWDYFKDKVVITGEYSNSPVNDLVDFVVLSLSQQRGEGWLGLIIDMRVPWIGRVKITPVGKDIHTCWDVLNEELILEVTEPETMSLSFRRTR